MRKTKQSTEFLQLLADAGGTIRRGPTDIGVVAELKRRTGNTTASLSLLIRRLAREGLVSFVRVNGSTVLDTGSKRSSPVREVRLTEEGWKWLGLVAPWLSAPQEEAQEVPRPRADDGWQEWQEFEDAAEDRTAVYAPVKMESRFSYDLLAERLLVKAAEALTHQHSEKRDLDAFYGAMESELETLRTERQRMLTNNQNLMSRVNELAEERTALQTALGDAMTRLRERGQKPTENNEYPLSEFLDEESRRALDRLMREVPQG